MQIVQIHRAFRPSARMLAVVIVYVVVCAGGGLDTPGRTRLDAHAADKRATAQSVAYRGNAAHTGSVDGVGLEPPLFEAWSHDLGYTVSYPIIAEGKVVVSYSEPPGGGSYGSHIIAYDALTGAVAWGPIPIEAVYFNNGLCYDDGTIYSLPFDGQLFAFDIQTGAPKWHVQLPEYFILSSPAARDGVVYVNGQHLHAVDGATGTILWSSSGGVSWCPPIIADDGIYAEYACGLFVKYRKSDGALLWRTYPPCSGGGGNPSTFYNDRVYIVDFLGNNVLDAADGHLITTHPSFVSPTFLGSVGFYLTENLVLEARSLDTGTLQWSFSGDGLLITAPVCVDGVVYVGSGTGELTGLDAVTGQIVWSENVGEPFYYNETPGASILQGIGAGDGLLVVPVGNRLIAYTSNSLVSADCPPDIHVASGATSGCQRGATVSFPLPVVEGPFCSTPTIVCLPASGSFFPEGTHQVRCTATDTCGNTGRCGFSITVDPAITPASSICVQDDATGDRFSEVVDSASGLYSYWTYVVASTGETICGRANRVSYTAGRSLVSSDSDGTDGTTMSAQIRIGGAATIRVRSASGRTYFLRDRNTSDDPQCGG